MQKCFIRCQSAAREDYTRIYIYNYIYRIQLAYQYLQYRQKGVTYSLESSQANGLKSKKISPETISDPFPSPGTHINHRILVSQLGLKLMGTTIPFTG